MAQQDEIRHRLKTAIAEAGGVYVVSHLAGIHPKATMAAQEIPNAILNFARIADALNISADYLLFGCEIGKGEWYKKGFVAGEQQGREAVINEFREFVKAWK